MNQLLLNKSFISKNGCLKVQLNNETKSFYLHIGKKKQDGDWEWIKTKLGDAEVGEILHVLKGTMDKTSFFHTFNERTKRTWVNKDDNGFFWVRVEDFRKQLSVGEQKVLEILLEKAIVASNAV